MEIDILIEAEGWSEIGLGGLAEQACPAVLTELGLDPAQFEVSILACTDARIAELNSEFRKKPKPTNVLSWPAREVTPQSDGTGPALPVPHSDAPPEALGDIAIALETCLAEAREGGKPVADHVTHLLVHATLHLLGFDHIRDGDAALMEGLETTILARLGVPDPY